MLAPMSLAAIGFSMPMLPFALAAAAMVVSATALLLWLNRPTSGCGASRRRTIAALFVVAGLCLGAIWIGWGDAASR